MAVKQKLLIAQRRTLEKKLAELRAKKKKLRADEAELEKQIEALEEVTPELEQQVEELEEQQTETDDAIADILDELDAIKEEIGDLEVDGPDDPNPDDGEPRPGLRSRGSAPRLQRRGTVSRSFRCRSRCFESRAAMESFYAQKPVADFISRVRSAGLKSGANRAISGADLAIPTIVLDLIRDNLGEYSKLLKHVRLRSVRGDSRAMVTGKVPEGIWTEMCARLNELAFQFTAIEMDGYKVGGFVTICRSVLKDASDVDLGEEIVENLLRAIGKACDKAIVFGLGPNSKMPVGFVTRLAQTEKPATWGVNQGPWTDLHTTNIMQLDLSSATGVAFYQGLLGAMGKAKPEYTNGRTVWVMNRATHMKIKAAGLVFTDAGALVASLDNSVPVEGGLIEELEFMPDGMVAGGFLDAYLMVEREGSDWARSDDVLFFEDMVAYKATARYDGMPILGEAFVAFTIDNSKVTTEMSFPDDLANEPLNALVITAATVQDGAITATITGAKSSSPRYAIQPTSASVNIHGNDVVIPGKLGWTKYAAGVVVKGAAAGQTLHVVELDDEGHIVSAGATALGGSSPLFAPADTPVAPPSDLPPVGG